MSSRGYEIFWGCVVLPQDVANVLQSGICACVNCRWKCANQQKCELKKRLANWGGAASPDDAPSRSSVADATDQVAHIDSSDDGRRDMISDGSEEALSLHVRHSKRLKSRGQPIVSPTVSVTTNVGTRAAGAVQKLTPNVNVDKPFSFRVDVIPPRTSLRLQPNVSKVLTCSLVMGQVSVKIQGEQTFDIGLMPFCKYPILVATNRRWK